MQSTKRAALEQLDKRHIWHPFTQHQIWEQEPIVIFERGSGNELIDVDGTHYLDGISSLWCNVHGHSEPRLLAAMHQQLDQLCHSTLLGATHRPVIELTEELLKVLPHGLTRLFYSDGGSVAVESAVRMSIEYWQKQESPAAKKRTKLLSLSSGYHGDTLGSVGVGYREDLHRALQSLVVPSLQVAPPHMFRFYEGLCESEALSKSLAGFSKAIAEQGEQIAACIIEPLVQGAAGIWIQPVEFVREVASICRAHGILLICDEVATGFGKTGAMFAVNRCGITPDLMTMGKGLTGGYLPMAAVAVSEQVFQAFYAAPEALKTFFFGQTFSGNPVAASVARASLELFAEKHVLARVEEARQKLAELLETKVMPLAHVDEIRQCGLMVGIELTAKPGSRQAYPLADLAGHRVTLAARSRGVLIRPLGNVVVLMPSLAMNDEELDRLVSVTAESIEAVLGR